MTLSELLVRNPTLPLAAVACWQCAQQQRLLRCHSLFSGAEPRSDAPPLTLPALPPALPTAGMGHCVAATRQQGHILRVQRQLGGLCNRHGEEWLGGWVTGWLRACDASRAVGRARSAYALCQQMGAAPGAVAAPKGPRWPLGSAAPQLLACPPFPASFPFSLSFLPVLPCRACSPGMSWCVRCCPPGTPAGLRPPASASSSTCTGGWVGIGG